MTEAIEMHALTIWQPWATLIMIGAKPLEFRGYPAPKSLIGKRVVIHAGARRIPQKELRELAHRVEHQNWSTGLDAAIALPLLSSFSKVMELPHTAGLGTAVVGKPRSMTPMFEGEGDSDRIKHHQWGWPMEDIRRWPLAIPQKGAQGFWIWPYATDADYTDAGHMPPPKEGDTTDAKTTEVA